MKLNHKDTKAPRKNTKGIELFKRQEDLVFGFASLWLGVLVVNLGASG
jgi:hypothetical protein